MEDPALRENLLAQRLAAEKFCADHLVECCREMLEFSDSTVLPAGRIRELAQLYSYAGTRALSVAQSEVGRQALMRVAADNTSK